MLVSATWVLPVSSEPIRDGAVLVEGARITAVGTRTELEAIAPAAAEQRHFVGATLMPGLVNAHTHLALTDLNGAVEPMPFAEWLPRLVAEMRPWQIADYRDFGRARRRAATQCRRHVRGRHRLRPRRDRHRRAIGLGGRLLHRGARRASGLTR